MRRWCIQELEFRPLQIYIWSLWSQLNMFCLLTKYNQFYKQPIIIMRLHKGFSFRPVCFRMRTKWTRGRWCGQEQVTLEPSGLPVHWQVRSVAQWLSMRILALCSRSWAPWSSTLTMRRKKLEQWKVRAFVCNVMLEITFRMDSHCPKKNRDVLMILFSTRGRNVTITLKHHSLLGHCNLGLCI